MKHLILLLCFVSSANPAFEQSFQRQINDLRKYISIADKRILGAGKVDTSIVGRLVGDVSIDRTLLNLTEPWLDPKDLKSTYQIHIFKMYRDTLKSYTMLHVSDEDYDKASYKWLNDTIVSVNLMNSVTGNKVDFKLTQSKSKCCSAGLLTN